MLIVPPDFCYVQLKIPKQISEEYNGHPTLCVMGCFKSAKFSVGKNPNFCKGKRNHTKLHYPYVTLWYIMLHCLIGPNKY